MDGEDQSQRGTQLLEIYALEIQMHNEMRNVKKLKVQPRIPLNHSDLLIKSSNVGNIQCIQQCALRNSTSADHGCYQGVRRQDVDGRK